MSRKGRDRKWKIPTAAGAAVRNIGVRALPAGETCGETCEEGAPPASVDEMVEATSPPAEPMPSAGARPPTGPATIEGESLQGTPAAVPREAGVPAAPHREVVETKSSPAYSRPRPEAPPLHFSSAPPPVDSAESDARRDDVSVPPVDLDSDFFEAHAAAAEAAFEVDTRDPRAAMKRTATAARRRAHLAKYVTGAVGLASTLCVAALFKLAIAPSQATRKVQHSSFAAQAAGFAPPALNVPPTTESPPSSLPAANSAPADRAAVAEPTPAVAEPPTPASASAEPAGPSLQGSGDTKAPELVVPAAGQAQAGSAAPSEEATPKSEEAPLDPRAAAKEAGKEKAKSRNALEWGKFADSIAAGEKSVAIDSTDAEAWLILGAAYQQKGDSKNAVRSFRTCVDQSKRGPKYECAAMLRSR